MEYEQLLIRANNLEPKNNSEYFIVDRQYATENRDRFDLTGFYWNSIARKKGQTVLCFLEIKFALNTDIKEVHSQINRYYDYISKHSKRLAEECQEIFRQKVLLGLLNQSQERMEALESLTFSENVDDYEFILVLVDYNPNSSLFNQTSLLNLPFASQMKIFQTGFAMWKQNVGAIK